MRLNSCSMIASVHSMAGLRSPAKSFTTNNESLNHSLKQKVDYKRKSSLLLINCSESSVNSKESVRRLYFEGMS